MNNATLFYITSAFYTLPRLISDQMNAANVQIRTFGPAGPYRSVPVPPEYLDTLNTAHGVREAQRAPRRAMIPIWPLSRVRVWQIVKGVMIEAGIADAPHRSPKGLRHGFGVNATVRGVPLHMLSKWMGHAQLSTTVIYADAVGREEQDIAARMWS